ncbi:MAG: hypothetical protein Q8R00_02545 [Candidatus Nanoarchaeia archaeon]|nr:hypothetical protein [Candidatus Nanoarchaeia archaeon]
MKGTSTIFPLATAQGASAFETFYGLRDQNGFDIQFIARGNRNIELEKSYTIKGTVIKDLPSTCVPGYTNCEPKYYLREIKL